MELPLLLACAAQPDPATSLQSLQIDWKVLLAPNLLNSLNMSINKNIRL